MCYLLNAYNNCMQEGPMNEDDPTKALSSRLSRLTWAINLWGTAITILLGITLFLSATTTCSHGP
jgi:cell division protein FtsX